MMARDATGNGGMSGALAAFRVDAVPCSGLGHLRRCLTLANELAIHGVQCHFVGEIDFGPEVQSVLRPHAHHFIQAVSSQSSITSEEVQHWDAANTLAVLDGLPASPHWVVLDNYSLSEPWEERVRSSGPRMLVLEDFRNRQHHADLIVSDTKAHFDPSTNSLRCGKALFGYRYSLVDPEYLCHGTFVEPGSGAKRLLVCYGSGAGPGETLKFIEAFRAGKALDLWHNRISTVDVIVAAGDLSAVKDAATGLEGIHVYPYAPSLAPLLRKAEIFITAGGVAMVEALALRKPCIVTTTGTNQALMVEGLASQGVIRSLGPHALVSVGDIQEMILRVLSELGPFAAHIWNRPVFDIFGARRIVTAMQW